mgnify:CR=1 FL=1
MTGVQTCALPISFLLDLTNLDFGVHDCLRTAIVRFLDVLWVAQGVLLFEIAKSKQIAVYNSIVELQQTSFSVDRKSVV